MKRHAVLLLGFGAAAAVATGVLRQRFVTARDGALAAVATGSQIIQTRSGTMEYAETGAGRPVLMLHGTGGGFDQGLAFSAPLTRAGFRVIAPSRFGYLRSDMPADASSEASGGVECHRVRHSPSRSLCGAGSHRARHFCAGPGPGSAIGPGAGHHGLCAGVGFPVLGGHDPGRGSDDRHPLGHRPRPVSRRFGRRTGKGAAGHPARHTAGQCPLAGIAE